MGYYGKSGYFIKCLGEIGHFEQSGNLGFPGNSGFNLTGAESVSRFFLSKEKCFTRSKYFFIFLTNSGSLITNINVILKSDYAFWNSSSKKGFC